MTRKETGSPKVENVKGVILLFFFFLFYFSGFENGSLVYAHASMVLKKVLVCCCLVRGQEKSAEMSEEMGHWAFIIGPDRSWAFA